MNKKPFSKSYLWAIRKAMESEDEMCSGLEWGRADEIDVSDFYFRDWMDDYGDEDYGGLGKLRGLVYDTDYYLKARIYVTMNPDLDEYDYVATAQMTHDGYYGFMNNVVHDTIERVLYAQSYAPTLRRPQSGDEVHYIIGNAVVLNEYRNTWGHSDDPLDTTRTTVLLPVKMWYGESHNADETEVKKD